MTLTPLAALAQAIQHPTPVDPWATYRGIIEHAITNQPRSQQKRIGPSEMGTPCDRCLIHKLAGTPEVEQHAGWLPFIGTAVHEQLESIFMAANRDHEHARYLVETTVNVGTVGAQDITGHCDLYDTHTGEVTDWKIVGATTLRDVKAHGPTTTYRTQIQLYGLGLERRGLPVNRVRIAYLPRNSVHLGDAIIWADDYRPDIARAAVARADQFATWIQVLGSETVLAAAPPHTHHEHSCSRFPDGTPPPGSGYGHTTTNTLLNLPKGA